MCNQNLLGNRLGAYADSVNLLSQFESLKNTHILLFDTAEVYEMAAFTLLGDVNYQTAAFPGAKAKTLV